MLSTTLHDAPTLTPHQAQAHDAALSFLAGKPGAFVLTGSAGTGKTTLLRTLCQSLSARRKTFGLMAPTGRAARVLACKTGVNTRTIHQHLYTPEPLKDRPGVRFVRKGVFADTFDVLIVDEASLVAARRGNDESFVAPAALLDDLLSEAERTNAHVVFVGDPCQLPPVGEDTSVALRADLLAEAYGLRTETAHLLEVMRQADGSDVLTAATVLRDRIEGRRPDPMPGLRRISWPENAVPDYLDAVAGGRYDQATVLTFMNRSAHRFNLCVRRRLGLEGLLTPGDLVVTDRDTLVAGQLIPRAETYVVEQVTPVPDVGGLTFADVRMRAVTDDGTVEAFAVLEPLADERGALTHEQEMNLFAALVRRNPGYPQTQNGDPYATALRLRYGHALTVHKAQGGEWPRVYLDTFVPNTVPAEQGLRWTYTALTRAADELCLLGRPLT